jgi:Rrf2 family nitric oxide-sensitive transcriptional repressor
MISQTSEYALRAIVFLGNEGVPRTTAEIAKATKAPSDYLSKVMRGLVREGIVASRRGLHGGFTLARLPEEMSMLDIINAVDPIQRIHECPLGNKAHGVNLCTLHRTIDETMARAEETFRNVSVDQILGEQKGARMCPFPVPTGKRAGGACNAQA